MEWCEMFKNDNQPGFDDIENYIGGEGKKLWSDLLVYMQNTYNAKPKMFYSSCSGKPGWNVKLQKSGVSFGTLYPERDGFSVFIVMAYKLDMVMEVLKFDLSSKMREMYDNAQDYMKNGKWMMFRIDNEKDIQDYKILVSAKTQPLKN